MRENHPVTLVVTGDGFTTNELAPNGLFESSAREALNCLFSVEPYKSYREYFKFISFLLFQKKLVREIRIREK